MLTFTCSFYHIRDIGLQLVKWSISQIRKGLKSVWLCIRTDFTYLLVLLCIFIKLPSTHVMCFALMFCWVCDCDVFVLCSDRGHAGVDCCDKACSAVGLIHMGHIENHDTHCVHNAY